MRHIIFLLFMAFTLQAIAQYPATGNKMRLGWQTTGDGLVYRGAIGDTATLDPSGINNAWMLLDTANGNLYAYRAKAWRLVSGGGGSVSDTLTGEVKGPLDSTYIDTVANIIFRLDSTAVGVGEVKYNDTQGSIQQGLKGGNVTNVIGQQLHQRVLNKTGSPIAKGEAVYLQGSQGNRITVAKAIATIDSTSANTFGIVAENIADNQSGYIITEGLITGLNTSALTEGAAVWLSPTVAGGLTTTKPQAPDHGVYIGVCVKQNNGSGELFVKIRNGQELEELHDVRITSPDSSASLYYNAAQGIWRDTTGAVLTSDTSVFARDFQISGTTNYIPKFTGANTIGNSQLFDNGTNVGIATSSPSYPLHINGTSYATTVITNGNFVGNGQLTTADARSGLVSIGPSSNTVPQYFMGGYGTFYGAGHTTKPGDIEFGVGQNTTGKIIFYTDNFGQNQTMTLTNNSFVGINTSSPSRPLHVAGTTAIRIPVGTTSDRGTSANGDIRYNTTNANFEWYSGTAWREPVNAARSPAVGLANRFSKFDANGLLDTSAVLTQSGNNIGIGVTPTERLQVEGTVRATRLSVNTFKTEVVSINNFAPGDSGNNLWIGNGGQSSSWTTGGEGGGNLGIGRNALFANTRGSGNLAIGTSALASNTTGNVNIAIGAGSIANSTQEANSIAIGAFTLQNNNSTTGENIAIGFSAMSGSVGGRYNVGIGASTLSSNTGYEHVAIGRIALASNTSGIANTAIGYYSSAFNTTGSYNVAIGHEAGAKTNAGGFNETSYQSIYIGRDARASASGNGNEIVIGEQGRGNGSNTTTIGNSSTTHTVLQYGETLLGYAASGDVGDYRVQVNGNGYVSGEFRIGYTADQGAYPLQVNGQIFATNATIATSDARLKQDIEPLKSGLKEVLSLNPVTYTFKPDTVNNYPKGKQVGFLAQEIQSTIQGDYAGSIVQEAGGYLGVADTKLIPLLVKAIQEQQAQIEALKKEIEALKNK